MSIFEPTAGPRVFTLPPGCDFAREFTQGLADRFAGSPPEALANSEIYLNTGRVRRGVVSAFSEQGAFLLPKLRLVTEFAGDVRFFDITPPVPALRPRLELFQAVSRLLEKDDRFAARSSAFDLADSLAELMDEMHAEGVSPGRISEIDVSQHSAHWAQSLKFLDIIGQFWGSAEAPDIQARQRMVIESLVDSWRREPPSHPVIVAGSTGSRGATRLLMQAAAGLPQGAVVLPCFDDFIPEDVWQRMRDSSTGEDHPQFRFKDLFDSLEMRPADAQSWRDTVKTNLDRNRLISLALRPAPVTSQWLTEGPLLDGIETATQNMALLEAPHPRAEAVAIALRLRQAAEFGEKAALVTPDRKLAKQVKSALARWEIQAEDSFETPLSETPPGRLLLLTACLFGCRPDPVSLISLLRHPLVHAESERQAHVRMADRLEHDIRHYGMKPDFRSQIVKLISNQEAGEKLPGWGSWLAEILDRLESVGEAPLTDIAAAHQHTAELLMAGSGTEPEAGIWEKAAGSSALEILQDLRREGSAGGVVDAQAYRHLLASLVRRTSVPRTDAQDFPGISIWNTLDARMQGPDLVIAGGLNEGTWPAATPVDSWLNRSMRSQAGLLMPERLTGLLAHDFQQAASVTSVVLSRSKRHAGEPAVSSRWLLRLITLLEGIGDHGKAALAAMRERGNHLLELAKAMEMPNEEMPRETRPNPKPPVSARPKQLPVTSIKTLISNPYEIYARYVLDLRELNPLEPDNFAAARGVAIHEILHKFVEKIQTDPGRCAADQLLAEARKVLSTEPAAQHVMRLWLAQLAGVAEEFVELERQRLEAGAPAALESKGAISLEGVEFTLNARADRVDRDQDGGLLLFDYKTGTIPGRTEIERRDKQIPLTAKMLELGGFPEIPAASVREAAYIAVGKSTKVQKVETQSLDETWSRFIGLIRRYENPETGYLSRRNMYQLRYGEAFDHLARYGEWEVFTESPEPPIA